MTSELIKRKLSCNQFNFKAVTNQDGPVWFLADHLGGREERICIILSGKAILIPLLTGECDYDIPEVKNDEDMRKCVTTGSEYGAIEATVDGVELKDLESYRTQSGYFNSSIAENNIYDSPAGDYRAFADGALGSTVRISCRRRPW